MMESWKGENGIGDISREDNIYIKKKFQIVDFVIVFFVYISRILDKKEKFLRTLAQNLTYEFISHGENCLPTSPPPPPPPPPGAVKR